MKTRSWVSTQKQHWLEGQRQTFRYSDIGISAPLYLVLGSGKKRTRTIETGNRQPKKILISFYLFSEGIAQSGDRPRKSSEVNLCGAMEGEGSRLLISVLWRITSSIFLSLYRGQWQAALKCAPLPCWLFRNKRYLGISQYKKNILTTICVQKAGNQSPVQWIPFLHRERKRYSYLHG